MDKTRTTPKVLSHQATFNSQPSSSNPRTSELWKKALSFSLAIVRLNRIADEVQLFGATKKTYSTTRSLHRYMTFIPPETPAWLLLPGSNFRKVWTFLISILLIYSAIVPPYTISFPDTSEVIALNLSIDILFFMDIPINFVSSYYSSAGELILTPQKIIFNYFFGWFFLDLFACMPLYLLGMGNYNKFLRVFRLYRMQRFFKVTKIYSLLARLSINREILRLVILNFKVIIIVHIFACVWHLTAQINHSTENWVYRNGMIDKDNFTLYMTSIYWAFTTLTTVGYGDIVPFTVYERIVTITLMALGVGFYSYAISNLSTIFKYIDTENSVLKSKLITLKQIAEQVHLPDELKERIKFHIKLNNKPTRTDHESLINELPSALRTELALFIYRHVVNKIYFMQDKDPGFISYIVPKLRALKLKPFEMLFEEHDFPEDMYFITRGSVNFIASNRAVFRCYRRGSYFGEEDIISNKTRAYAANACEEGADLLVLSRKYFLKLLEEFPRIANEFVEVARKKTRIHSRGKNQVLDCQASFKRDIFGRRWRSVRKKKVNEFVKDKNRKMWLSVGNHEKSPISPAPPLITTKSLPLQAVLGNQGSQKKQIKRLGTKRYRDNIGHLFDVRDFIDEASIKWPVLENEEKQAKEGQLVLLRYIKEQLSQHNAKISRNLNLVQNSLVNMKKKHLKIQGIILKMQGLTCI